MGQDEGVWNRSPPPEATVPGTFDSHVKEGKARNPYEEVTRGHRIVEWD